MVDLPVEECHALYLNQAGRVIDSICVSSGGVAMTAVDNRVILREAFLRRASAITLCHNHPSGNLSPSKPDDDLTRRLYAACKIVQIPLLDHIIFTDNGYYSYADRGNLE